MKGGRPLPQYVEPYISKSKNDPYMPKIQKQNYGQRKREESYPTKGTDKEKMDEINSYLKNKKSIYENKDKQPMVNLQIYNKEDEKPKYKRNEAYDYMPAYARPEMLQQGYIDVPKLPIVNKNIINVSGGPLTNHSQLNTIYEGIFPESQVNLSFTTINERKTVRHFLRNVLINRTDGEDKPINGLGSHGLMNYLKFLNLNPLNSSIISNNPYQSLPDDMLIYGSCYPIKFDEKKGESCAKSSSAINVRIYRLTDDQFNSRQSKLSKYNHDVWRELGYYNNINENIIKNKICPNFTNHLMDFMSTNSGVDFDSLLASRKKVGGNSAVSGTYGTMTGGDFQLRPSKVIEKVRHPSTQNINVSMVGAAPAKLPGNTSKHCHVILTESPTHAFIKWASRKVEASGIVNKEIYTGFFSDDVWRSVYFQIAAALYTMQKEKFAYWEITIDNIFIKELSHHGNTPRYWLYIIDGFEFYVPNYGFMVVFDSVYKENDKAGENYKIYSNELYDTINDSKSDDNIEDIVFEGFKKIFNEDVFSDSTSTHGVIKPSNEIINWLNNINTSATNSSSDKSIKSYMLDNMSYYLHNRLGTYFKKRELSYINQSGVTCDLKPGKLYAYSPFFNEYKYVMLKKKVGGNSTQVEVITRNDSKEIITETVEGASLKSIFNHVKVDQLSNNGKVFTINNMIEKYIIQ